MMHVLTLWHPWAGAMALGLKRIETRSWRTDYRGDVAIHAAKAMPKTGNAMETLRAALQVAATVGSPTTKHRRWRSGQSCVLCASSIVFQSRRHCREYTAMGFHFLSRPQATSNVALATTAPAAGRGSLATFTCCAIRFRSGEARGYACCPQKLRHRYE